MNALIAASRPSIPVLAAALPKGGRIRPGGRWAARAAERFAYSWRTFAQHRKPPFHERGLAGLQSSR